MKYHSFFISFLLWVCSVNGFTQETERPIKEVIGKDSVSYYLPTITVTATRIAEPVIEVPMAVTIITKPQMEKQRGYGIDEALTQSPGVLAQSRYGNSDVRITIRGFGARGAGDRSNAGTSRGIRVLLNGLPQTEPDGRTSFDMIDPSITEKIEVVRSNASAVWGNAGGGIISISTVPVYDGYFATVRSKFGSFGLQEYTAQTGTMIGATKFFASYVRNRFDGWRQHSASSRDLMSMGIESRLTEQTVLGLNVMYTFNAFDIPGPLNAHQFDTLPKQANPKYLTQDERRINKLGLFGMTIDHQINPNNGVSGMVYVNPKYLQRSERNTFRDFTRYHFGGSATYRNQMKFSDDLKNTVIAGFDGSYQDGAILFYSLNNGQRGTSLGTNKREGARNLGAFFQDEFNVNEQWSFLAGLRYDGITYFNEGYPVNNAAADYKSRILGLQSKTFKGIIPKAGVSYRFTENHSVYANLGGGIEVPAGNETDPSSVNGYDTIYTVNPLLDPIKSTTIEVGTKQILSVSEDGLLRALDYDAALYWIQVKNDLIPYKAGRFYLSAGETRRMGVEFALNTNFNYGLSVSSNLTYASNKYKDYSVDSLYAGFNADYGNNKVAGLPDLYYKFAVKYIPLFFNHVFVEFQAQGVGKYWADDANTYEVPSYKIFSLSFGTSKPIQFADHLYLNVFAGINNLLDRKYAASAFINPDIVSNQAVYLEPGLPRNYYMGASLSWK